MPFINEKRKTVKKREGKIREKRRDITVKKEKTGKHVRDRERALDI